MSIFTTLLKNDIKTMFKNYKVIILNILIPLLIVAFLAINVYPLFKSNKFITPFDIAYVNNDQSLYSDILLDQMKNFDIFKTIHEVTEDQAIDLINENKIASAIILPENFFRNIYHFTEVTPSVYTNINMPFEAYIVENLMLSSTKLLSSSQAAVYSIYEFYPELNINSKDLNNEATKTAFELINFSLDREDFFENNSKESLINLSATEFMLSNLLIMFIMFSGIFVIKNIISDKNSGIINRLISSRVSIFLIIISKLTTYLLISIIQISLISLFSSVLFDNYLGESILEYALLILPSWFAVTGWILAISAISRNSQVADWISSLSILLMTLLGGGIYPLYFMPDVTLYLSKLTINYWSARNFMNLFSYNPSYNYLENVMPLLLIGISLYIFSFSIILHEQKKGRFS